MTGFKLHYPPGFVDRAYLVFLWLLSLLTELPTLSTDLGRSHLHSSLGRGCGLSAEVRAPGRQAPRETLRITFPTRSGSTPGGQGGDSKVLSAPTASSFRSRPPGGACPSLQPTRAESWPAPRIRPNTEQSTCQRYVGVMGRRSRVVNRLTRKALRMYHRPAHGEGHGPRRATVTRRGYGNSSSSYQATPSTVIR